MDSTGQDAVERGGTLGFGVDLSMRLCVYLCGGVKIPAFIPSLPSSQPHSSYFSVAFAPLSCYARRAPRRIDCALSYALIFGDRVRSCVCGQRSAGATPSPTAATHFELCVRVSGGGM